MKGWYVYFLCEKMFAVGDLQPIPLMQMQELELYNAANKRLCSSLRDTDQLLAMVYILQMWRNELK